MRRRVLVTLITAVAVATSFASAVPASSSPNRSHPAVSWHFANRDVSAGRKPTVVWSGSHLRRGWKIELQRQNGTAHVWRHVARLPGNSGHRAVKAVGMGRYGYRIRVVSSNGNVVLATGTKLLKSYGNVSLSTLSRSPNAQCNNFCGSSTVQVGSHVFVYTVADCCSESPDYDQAFVFPRNTCRSLSLAFAVDNEAATDTSGLLSVVQTSLDQQSGSAPYGAIERLNARLDGGPWYLNTSQTDTSGDGGVHINGSASCWTPTGE